MLKSAPQHFYLIVSSIWDKSSWKTPPFVRCEISRLFVNNLIDDDMYCCHDTENFLQPIQMQVSKKLKNLKSTSNFEQFELKDELHSLSISDIIESERRGYVIVEKVFFQCTEELLSSFFIISR